MTNYNCLFCNELILNKSFSPSFKNRNKTVKKVLNKKKGTQSVKIKVNKDNSTDSNCQDEDNKIPQLSLSQPLTEILFKVLNLEVGSIISTRLISSPICTLCKKRILSVKHIVIAVS
jgi:hypothetical protein